MQLIATFLPRIERFAVTSRHSHTHWGETTQARAHTNCHHKPAYTPKRSDSKSRPLFKTRIYRSFDSIKIALKNWGWTSSGDDMDGNICPRRFHRQSPRYRLAPSPRVWGRKHHRPRECFRRCKTSMRTHSRTNATFSPSPGSFRISSPKAPSQRSLPRPDEKVEFIRIGNLLNTNSDRKAVLRRGRSNFHRRWLISVVCDPTYNGTVLA